MAKKPNNPLKSLDDFDTEFKDLSMVQGDRDDLFLSTGSFRLDAALGGFRRGSMSEIFGPTGGGKSTVALASAAEVLRADGVVAWHDLENSIHVPQVKNPKTLTEKQQRLVEWLIANGVDPWHPNFRLYHPPVGERMYDHLDRAIQSGLFDLGVVDSVAAISSRAELEGDIGDANYGSVANLNSKALKRLTTRFGVAGNRRTHIIFINQVRDNIGARIKSYKPTGGNALPHYARQRLKINQIGVKLEGNTLLKESVVQIIKNNWGPSPLKITIFIHSKRGLDRVTEIFNHALESDILHQAGAWYYLYDRPVSFKALKAANEEKSPTAGFISSFQGAGNVKDWIVTNIDFQEKVASTITPTMEVDDAD